VKTSPGAVINVIYSGGISVPAQPLSAPVLLFLSPPICTFLPDLLMNKGGLRTKPNFGVAPFIPQSLRRTQSTASLRGIRAPD